MLEDTNDIDRLSSNRYQLPKDLCKSVQEVSPDICSDKHMSTNLRYFLLGVGCFVEHVHINRHERYKFVNLVRCLTLSDVSHKEKTGFQISLTKKFTMHISKST
jgi:hypothetical protein